MAIILSENKFNLESKNLRIILFILFVFHLISFLSLYQFDVDIIQNYIYGESRHLVQSNTLVDFRPSGIFQ